jgi:chaperone LolA
MIKNFLIRAFFLFCLPFAIFAQEKADGIVAKIRQTYEKLESLKGEFEQQYTWSLAGETQTLNGTLYLKKGDRYRVETPNQMIITDGKTVWTYSLDKKQVMIDRLEKSKDNPLPRDLILKYTRDFKARLLRSEKFGGVDCYVIALTPREEDAFVQSVTAWIDKTTYLAPRIEQVDINDNKTVYLLKNAQRNAPLADALFSFKIPDDAEVVDMR